MNNSFEETNRIIREAGTGWDNVADPVKALEELRRDWKRILRSGRSVEWRSTSKGAK